MRCACSTNGGEKQEHTECGWGNLKERDHLKYLVMDGDNIKRGPNEMGWDGMAETELISHRIGTFGGLLCTR